MKKIKNENSVLGFCACLASGGIVGELFLAVTAYANNDSSFGLYVWLLVFMSLLYGLLCLLSIKGRKGFSVQMVGSGIVLVCGVTVAIVGSGIYALLGLDFTEISFPISLWGAFISASIGTGCAVYKLW